jgi:predicted kinase
MTSLESMSEMLIVFGGLPGVGKTTIARAVAVDQQATYLRIDTIEHAIRAAGLLRGDVGTAGYDVANAIARENLAAGRIVIVDCVNPVIESRTGWRVTAA